MNTTLRERKQTDWLVVSCIDFRLQRLLLEALQTSFGVVDPDMIATSGGARALASDQTSPQQQVILFDLNLAVTHHGVKQIVLLNHQNCGRYGLEGDTFSDESAEVAFHRDELTRATAWVRKHFPNIQVTAGLVQFSDNSLSIEAVA